VHNALLVGRLHGPGQGLDQLGGPARRLGRAAQPVGEAAALDVLQGEVRVTLVLADLVDLHHVGVLEPGRRLALGAEAPRLRRGGHLPGQEHLEGHGAVEARLPRLEPVVRDHGLSGFEELARRPREPGGAALPDAVVEAITTGETACFRDGRPFEAFRHHVLPDLAARGRRVRLWGAGVATGQEAYSVAMIVAEFVEAGRGRGAGEGACSVLATDVSARALAVARAGEYTRPEVARGLSAAQLARHFEPRGERWVAREPVRRLVEFRRANLGQPFAGLGTFDAIFCRNVLIDFDDDTRRRVCAQLRAALADGGWLLLGSAENLFGIADGLEPVRLGDALFYRRPPDTRG
jgi:chemotaxis protein methyltransferase CheR